MNFEDKKDILNDYATRSLRYTADQDYISARANYKANLIEPFLWSSLHALEKYLKAILLFHTISIKTGYGHNIEKLLDAVENIDTINLRLPEGTKEFIKYINFFGQNRYFETEVFLDAFALDNLDSTVWFIRRQCYDMREYEGRGLKEISPELQESNPKNYKLPNGFLEKVIKDKLEAHYHLALDNWFYGENEYTRDEIRKKQNKFSAINPPLSFHGKRAFDILKDYIYISSETKELFKDL